MLKCMTDLTDSPARPDVPLSILDLAAVGPNETIGDSFAGSVRLAQSAERIGYRRIWYAEHHNIRSIASSATAVLIAHVAAHTEKIRLGAGGIMLPNHSPLVIAEQFGTLAELHPGRIDLGLGRAPGSDTAAMRALRRDELSSERFPQDVRSCRAGSATTAPSPASSRSPARAPTSRSTSSAPPSSAPSWPRSWDSPTPSPPTSPRTPSSTRCRSTARTSSPPSSSPSPTRWPASASSPPTDKAEAERQLEVTRRIRVKSLFKTPGGGKLTDDEVDQILDSPRARAVDEMLTYSAVGTGPEAAAYLADFQSKTGADELITVHYADSVDNRIRSVEILAEAAALSEPAAA